VFCFFLYFFFFFCRTWTWTQCLPHARQVLYLLSHVSSPFICILFLRKGLHNFAQVGLELAIVLPLPPEQLELHLCTTTPGTLFIHKAKKVLALPNLLMCLCDYYIRTRYMRFLKNQISGENFSRFFANSKITTNFGIIHQLFLQWSDTKWKLNLRISFLKVEFHSHKFFSSLHGARITKLLWSSFLIFLCSLEELRYSFFIFIGPRQYWSAVTCTPLR
jgi:hypothetical protein